MEYEAFKEELIRKMAIWSETSDKIGEYKLFLEGESADVSNESDKQFIKDTNITFFNLENDVLMGDFLRVNHKSDVGIARYSVKKLYETLQNSDWEHVNVVITENLKYTETLNIQEIQNRIAEYDYMKARLIIRPINYDDNKYDLDNCIYRCVGDIALVLYVIVSDSEEQFATLKVKKRFSDFWGKSDDELFEVALVNSYVRNVPRMYSIIYDGHDYLRKIDDYMNPKVSCKLPTGTNNATFSTEPELDGAISFWYPGVSDKIAEMAGGDYYVVFNRRTEFHIHPVGTTIPNILLDTLNQINLYNSLEGAILSRHIFLYKAEEKELVKLDL